MQNSASGEPSDTCCGIPSLRERRRQQTWEALHDAAAEAALAGDAERSSVEAIAAAAGVSPRTFFNYFGSKDEAVFGYRPPHVPEKSLASLDPSGEPLVEATRLLLATMRSAHPAGTPARRQQLIEQNPALGRFRVLALGRAEELVVSALEEHFSDDPRVAGAPGGPAEALRMLAALAGAILRHATTHPEHTPGAPLTDDTLQRSIDIFHHLHRRPE
ncbi:TetR family transcriptional regulator [Kytococcus sp. Marseille-QA3725]